MVCRRDVVSLVGEVVVSGRWGGWWRPVVVGVVGGRGAPLVPRVMALSAVVVLVVLVVVEPAGSAARVVMPPPVAPPPLGVEFAPAPLGELAVALPAVGTWRGSGSREVIHGRYEGTSRIAGKAGVMLEPARGVSPDKGELTWGASGEMFARRVVAFTGDGHFEVGFDAHDCRFDKPVLKWPSPLAVGRSWAGTGKCEYSGSRGGMTLSIAGEVEESGEVVVGGERLPAFVVATRVVRMEQRGTGRGKELRLASDRERIVVVPAFGFPLAVSRGRASLTAVGDQIEHRRERTQFVVSEPLGARG